MQKKPALVWDMGNLAWQDQANCKGLPVDMFYYNEEDLTRRERNHKERMALKVCNNCVVKEQCLQDAIDRNDAHSIQGGTTPRDRGHRIFVPELNFPTISADRLAKRLAKINQSKVEVIQSDFEKGDEDAEAQTYQDDRATDDQRGAGTTVSR